MPSYDAFGREVEPDAARTAERATEVRPAGDAPAPRRPRRSGPSVVWVAVGLVLAIAIAVITLASGGGGSEIGRPSPITSDLERSQQEFEDTIDQLEPDPDAPSALTAKGAEGPLAAIREEEADGPPPFVVFEPDQVLAGLLIDGNWFGMAVARGQTVTNGLRLSDPPADDVRRLPWDAIDLSALDRVVEASGGEREVARAIVSVTKRDRRWTVSRFDGTERRFDLSARPL